MHRQFYTKTELKDVTIFLQVLRPFCKVPNLKVWKYYTTENLSTGPTYDLELINDVTTTVENEGSPDGKQVWGKKKLL